MWFWGKSPQGHRLGLWNSKSWRESHLPWFQKVIHRCSSSRQGLLLSFLLHGAQRMGPGTTRAVPAKHLMVQSQWQIRDIMRGPVVSCVKGFLVALLLCGSAGVFILLAQGLILGMEQLLGPSTPQSLNLSILCLLIRVNLSPKYPSPFP